MMLSETVTLMPPPEAVEPSAAIPKTLPAIVECSIATCAKAVPVGAMRMAAPVVPVPLFEKRLFGRRAVPVR
jgi:hypothetical protein